MERLFRLRSARYETGKEETGRGVEEWRVRSSASDSAPSASDSEAGSVGEELEAKVKREKALAGGEDVTDIIGDEGDSSMGDVAGESVDDASSSSRSRSAAGSDSVCVCSHCSRRAVVGEHEDDGRRVGLGVGGRRFGDDRVGERRRDEANRGDDTSGACQPRAPSSDRTDSDRSEADSP